MKKSFLRPIFYKILIINALLMYFIFNINAQITGNVFRDFNANGIKTTATPDPIEPGLKDVTVNAYDAGGGPYTATTDSNGDYSITAGTGSYRVEFILPPFYYASKGSASNTTVQFVAAGGTANLGVNHPGDYLTNPDAPIFIPILWGDSWPDATVSSHANETALKMFKESNSGLTPVPSNIATLGQIGNTWGTAFHNQSKTVFASTFFRKYGGFGPSGQSAIYYVKAGADGNFGTGDDATGTFIKLDDYFGANSTGSNAFGTILRGDSLLVSKVAYGDIEISADAKTLYAINLYDRKIYKIPVNKTADTPPLGSITTSGLSIPDAADCTGTYGVLRPFGLAINRGDNKLYVSATCEGTGKIYVWGYDTATDTWDAAPILSYSPVDSPFPDCCWKNWYTTVGYEKTTLAMGLDFDKSGNFLNLTYINRRIYTESETNGMRNNGNVVRFCFNGISWNIENAGVSCGITGFSTTNNGGPNGGEFYDDTSVEGGEGSIMGAALQIPGRATAALTMDDPINLYSAGVIYVNNDNGTQSARYETLPNAFVYPPPPLEFDGKRNAMGDIEYLSETAPIEIGNRVFMDTDSDGEQDPNEMGLDGIKVELWKAGAKVTETTTANAGQWFFTNLDAATAYEVKILSADIPSGKSLTTTNTATNAKDLIDSDASLVGSDAVIAYTTGNAGENNHTLDFGFKVACALAATAVGTNPTCANNDGSIALTVTGATGTPTFLWSNGATIEDPTALSAGPHTVTVTDGSCTATATVTIEVIPSNIQQQMCIGESYKLEIQDNTLTGIQWKKDGVDIAGANGLTYNATQVGVYTYTSNGVGGCAVGQCCPIELTLNPSCCKPKVCTTVKITRN